MALLGALALLRGADVLKKQVVAHGGTVQRRCLLVNSLLERSFPSRLLPTSKNGVTLSVHEETQSYRPVDGHRDYPHGRESPCREVEPRQTEGDCQAGRTGTVGEEVTNLMRANKCYSWTATRVLHAHGSFDAPDDAEACAILMRLTPVFHPHSEERSVGATGGCTVGFNEHNPKPDEQYEREMLARLMAKYPDAISPPLPSD